MKSFLEAKKIIQNKAHASATQKLPLHNCLNLISSEDIFAPMDVPSFDNSAMDGYIFRFEDYVNKQKIQIKHEIQAGANEQIQLNKYESAKIFTGAYIPKNGDTVVAQEDVTIKENLLQIKKEISKGTHIRGKGTQTKKGSLVLKKGDLLTAEYIGFLATLGIDTLEVYTKPKVGIITTGKELVPLGKTLKTNQIYDSNSIYLQTVLEELNIVPEFCVWVDDDATLLKNTLAENIEKVDILIITGGISVGKYDYVKSSLESIGVKEHIYKVKQKPGKPLFYGTLDKKNVFALPGNPAAVVSCFHSYIKPFINTIMQKDSPQQFGILLNEFSKKTGLTHIVKVFTANKKIEILPNQLSYQMDSFSKANALAIFREEQDFFSIGEKVPIIKF